MHVSGRASSAYDPAMPRGTANGIEVEYESIGEPGDPVLVLISGLGSQLISWHDDFCTALAARGFRVIRFDNRDVGLSSKLADGPEYTLADMADDVAGLLDLLGVAAAHIVGASMGGMIAQMVAVRHPERVLSLTSMMSTTGAADVGGADPEAAARLVVPPGTTRDDRIASSIQTMRVTWGDTPEFPFDEDAARARATAQVDRAYYPDGVVRQMFAIRATGDRTGRLRELDVPAVVIHGDNDPLVRVSGGEATAAAIPGAELVVIHGMGHAVDRRAWPTIIDAIERTAQRAAAPTT